MKTHLFFLSLIVLLIVSPLSINAQDENTLDLDSLAVMTAENGGQIVEIDQLSNDDYVSDLAFSPDGNTLAVTADYQEISELNIWNIRHLQEPQMTVQGDNFLTVAFSNDGVLVAVGGDDFPPECECVVGSVHILDANTGQELGLLKGRAGQYAVSFHDIAFNPESTELATAAWGLGTWNIGEALQSDHLTIEENMRFINPNDEYSVWDVNFSPDGELLAYSTSKIVGYAESWYLFGEHQIILWDTSSQSVVDTLRGHSNIINAIAFSPDGSQIVSGSGEIVDWKDNNMPVYGEDSSVRFWNVKTRQQQTMLSLDSKVESLAFSPNGQVLAAGDRNGGIHIVDVETGIEVALLEGHSWGVVGLAFSPNGKLLVSGGDSTIRFWGIQD